MAEPAPNPVGAAARAGILRRDIGRVLALCLLSGAGSVVAADPPPRLPEQLLGHATQDGAGLLVWSQTREQRIADGAGVGIRYILALDPAGEGPKRTLWLRDTEQPAGTSAVRAPGDYEIQATCQTGRGFEFRTARLTIKAGNRYLLRCLGKSRRSVRLQIDEY